MLERATACLNAGARQPESLRCVRRALRSRRALHSTFWTHGAGALDLAISLENELAPTATRSSRADDQQLATAGGRSSSEPLTCSAPDGRLFLDFLYPPQTLAYIDRVNRSVKISGYGFGRWDRKTMRSPREHVSRASRGYASRSQPLLTDSNPSDKSETNIGKRSEEMEETDNVSSLVLPEEKTAKNIQVDPTEIENVRYTGGFTGEQDALSMLLPFGKEGDATQARRSRSSQSREDTTNALESQPNLEPTRHTAEHPINVGSAVHGLADFPGLITEQGPDFSDQDLISTLDVLLDRRPQRPANLEQHPSEKIVRANDVELVCDTYNRLSDEQRADKVLQNRALRWLAHFESEKADKTFLMIWDELPAENRELRVCIAALKWFARRRMPIETLHQDNLKYFPEEEDHSYLAIILALENDDWDLAVRIANTLLRSQSGTRTAESRDRVLEKIAGSNLRPAVFRMVQSTWATEVITACTNTENDTKVKSDQDVEIDKVLFAQSICRPLVFKLLDRKPEDPKFVKITNYLDLVEFVVALMPVQDRPAFMESLIDKFLQMPASMRYKTWNAKILVRIYDEYRALQGVKPPENLLSAFLNWLKLAHDMPELRSVRRLLPSIEDFLDDWERFHEKLSVNALSQLLTRYTKVSDVKRVEDYFRYLKEEYPDFSIWGGFLWTLIHARARGSISEALEAFDRVRVLCNEHDQEPDDRCWDSLMYAHYKADDIHSAIQIFKTLSERPGRPPSHQAFHMIAMMLATRGDVDGVQEWLQHYDEITKMSRTTHLVGSIMVALLKNDEYAKAEAVLVQSMRDGKAGKITGDHTKNCNLLLTAYGDARDMQSTMRIYEAMRRDEIRLSSETYSAILRALTFVGKTAQAFNFLRKAMEKNGVRLNASHFWIIMVGFINQKQYREAVWAHALMIEQGVPRTKSSDRIYLRAKSLLEMEMKRKFLQSEAAGTSPESRYDDQGNPLPTESSESLDESLLESLQDLETSLPVEATDEGMDGFPVTLRPSNFHESKAVEAYFEHLLSIHSPAKCLDAVRNLFDQYVAKDAEAPANVLAALMATLNALKQYEDVEACWELAKEQADRLTAPVELSDIKSPTVASPVREELESHDEPVAAPSNEARSQSLEDDEPLDDSRASVSSTAVAIHGSSSNSAVRHITGKTRGPRMLILSRPFYQYLRACIPQQRGTQAISTLLKLLHEGYRLDNLTWNITIEALCTESPPLVLLAFALTEKYLIPDWPGWSRRRPKGGVPKSQTKYGLQHINARYLRRDHLIPQYKTLVMLGSAFLSLRHLEDVGRRHRRRKGERAGDQVGFGEEDGPEKEDLHRYVGTMREIRQRAPRTLYIVQSMPRVDDDLQREMLRREA